MIPEPPILPLMVNDETVANATLLFQYMESQITFADSKAELAILADAFLASSVVILSQGSELNFLNTSLSPVARFAGLFILFMVISLLLSIFYALLAARPRITRILAQQQKPLFYFGYITELTEQEFIRRFADQTPDELHRAILSQIYAKAHIARAKFMRMRTSLNFLMVAVVFWTLVLILLGFTK
jgi:hypothetical protein